MRSGDIITIFDLPGKPVGKERPSGKDHRYLPKKTQDYQREIGWAAKAGMRTKTVPPQAVGIDIAILITPPKMWKAEERVRALKGEIRPVTRPDTDNTIKAIMDGCNKIAYRDDQQVSEIILRRTYAENDNTRVTVYLL